ncbi:MAG: tetratricopeptide repeat protein [Burkholderiales bacterium]|nr:tetratricopeptide repeat protein [Burkholderiales bacterium]
MSATAGRAGSRGWALAAIAVAAVLAWRILVAANDAWHEGGLALVLGRDMAGSGHPSATARWRAQVGRNPTDVVALLALGRAREAEGDLDGARAAIERALRLAPTDRVLLIEAAAFDARTGDAARSLALLREVVDLHPDAYALVWPVFSAALDEGRHDDFFVAAARGDPRWWPSFFAHACGAATSVEALERVFAVRAAAGAASVDERRCLIGRLQREGRWTSAYQAWLNSLPPAARQHVGYVYNGDFERPLSNLGFDWIVERQDGIVVEREPAAGASGRALRVELLDKRWSGSPIQQTLLLVPGRYRFEGRGRVDRLETWLGLQWGLYCVDSRDATPRELVHTRRFAGSSGWAGWGDDFVVPRDCPVQRLRLELANPLEGGAGPGDVAARLSGNVWFDDLRIRGID